MEIKIVNSKTGEKEIYSPVVFLINTKENGVPRLCTMISMDKQIHLAGGEEFMTAFVPKQMLEANNGTA